ncbi:hypothetical protein ACRALDRAFT_213277 [Sodiomyces alcalophilus JCM 7366]|uniref:uncharacterized protein n=1 Tax=Sodiomyces alcalophilus JCM 7366 TaxID=591952 RepID=UPI0039B69631
MPTLSANSYVSLSPSLTLVDRAHSPSQEATRRQIPSTHLLTSFNNTVQGMIENRDIKPKKLPIQALTAENEQSQNGQRSKGAQHRSAQYYNSLRSCCKSSICSGIIQINLSLYKAHVQQPRANPFNLKQPHWSISIQHIPSRHHCSTSSTTNNMTRWSHLDSDRERLPDDLVRIGYDADTQQYTFQGSDGSIWEGPSGSSYGNLTRISGPPTTTTTTAGPSSRNGVSVSATSQGDYDYPEEVYEEEEADYEYEYSDTYEGYDRSHTMYRSEEPQGQICHCEDCGMAGPSRPRQQQQYRRPNTSDAAEPSYSQQVQQYYRGQPSTSEHWRPVPRGNISRAATEHYPRQSSRNGGDVPPRSSSHRHHGRQEQGQAQQQRQDEGRRMMRRTLDNDFNNAAERLAQIRRDSRRQQIARVREGGAAGALRALVGRVRQTFDSIQYDMRESGNAARQQRPQRRQDYRDPNYRGPHRNNRDRRETIPEGTRRKWLIKE